MDERRISLADVKDAYARLGWQPVVDKFYTYLDDGDIEVECGCPASALGAVRFYDARDREGGDFGSPSALMVAEMHGEKMWSEIAWGPDHFGILVALCDVSPAYLAGYIAGYDGYGVGEAFVSKVADPDPDELMAGWEDGLDHRARLFPARVVQEYGETSHLEQPPDWREVRRD